MAATPALRVASLLVLEKPCIGGSQKVRRAYAGALKCGYIGMTAVETLVNPFVDAKVRRTVTDPENKSRLDTAASQGGRNVGSVEHPTYIRPTFRAL